MKLTVEDIDVFERGLNAYRLFYARKELKAICAAARAWVEHRDDVERSKDYECELRAEVEHMEKLDMHKSTLINTLRSRIAELEGALERIAPYAGLQGELARAALAQGDKP